MREVKTIEFGDVNWLRLDIYPDGTACVTVDDYEGGSSFFLTADMVQEIKSALLEVEPDVDA